MSCLVASLLPNGLRSMSDRTIGPNATHGAASTYRNGCRCGECRAAHTERTRWERQSRADRLNADPKLAPHGTYTTYENWGCRCKDCAAAHRERMRSPEHRASVARSRARQREASA